MNVGDILKTANIYLRIGIDFPVVTLPPLPSSNPSIFSMLGSEQVTF